MIKNIFYTLSTRTVIHHSIIAFISVMVLASCGSGRKAVSAKSSGAYTATEKIEGVKSDGHFTAPSGISSHTHRLLDEANSWIGVPYRYGGTSRRGVDCSGFVLLMYQRALDIDLPRNSAMQQEYCRSIERKKLREGDLIFFTSSQSKNISHVGIYIGNDRMVHASTSKGVIVTSLSQPYYVKHLHSYGRVPQYEAMLSTTDSKADLQIPTAKVESPQPNTDEKNKTRKAIRTTVATDIPPATKAAMERNRQKVLNSIIEQKADSIFSTKQ